MIYDHDMPEYRERWERMGADRYNGAFYYSKEIVRNIVPRVETDRSWVTINQEGCACDHAIVFVHNNLHPEHYDWLAAYRDLVLVCGVPSTCGKVAHLGISVYLPLSVDVAYVERFKREKDRGTCFYGRVTKVGDDARAVDHITGRSRERALPAVARYERCYAVGRCAIEARVLGCEVLPYDPRFPDPSLWKVLDNAEAAAMLQAELDRIDGEG